MVPCPWFEEIAGYAIANPTGDFGLHLTHTSEWKVYKWGPVANRADVPGLVTSQGYLWPDIEPIYKNATPAQAEVEARAQVRRALDRGIDVTHLDSHMGALQFADPYFQVYRELASEFNLPIRMGSQATLAAFDGAHQRGQLEGYGIAVTGRIPHVLPPNEHNRFYLETKAKRSGHFIDFGGRTRLLEQDDPIELEGMSEPSA